MALRTSFHRSLLVMLATVICSAAACSRASQVVAWGGNYYGQTNIPPGLTDVVALAAGHYHNLVLHGDGTVTNWGRFLYGDNAFSLTLPLGLTNVTAIAAGPGHDLVLRSDGTIVTWGYSLYGLANVPPSLTNAVAIAAGQNSSLALKADGTVVGWGYNAYGQATPPPELVSNVVAIACGKYHGLAVKADGTVAAWGWNYYGQSTVPSGLSNVVVVAGGDYHSLALKADGSVVAWGYSGPETTVPPGLTNVVAIGAYGTHSAAIRANGTVVIWGSNAYGERVVPSSVTNAAALAGGASHSLALTGDVPPRSKTLPLNLTVPLGRTVSLPSGVSGTKPFSYQWQLNSTNLLGATNMAFAMSNVQSNNGGTYSVIVSNPFGTATISYSLVTAPLVITVHPQNQSVFGGSTVTFGVAATGMALNYQWRFNGTNLAAANNNTLTLTNVLPEQAGVYSVVVSNFYGAVVSSNAVLNITALGITSQPQSQSVFGGATATISAVAAGVPPLSYQWQFNGTNLVSATNSSLTLTNVLPNQAGVYAVVVSNVYGMMLSSNAVLNVIGLGITSQPQSVSVFGGSTVVFGVTAAGVPPMNYQWQFAGTNMPSATNSALVLTNVLPSHAGTYVVVVSNDYATVTSSVATLDVTALGITSQPEGQITFQGATILFMVAAAGVSPLNYQWRFNGVNVIGATASTLALTNVQYNQSGTYSVVVSNSFDVIASGDASLTVMPIAIWGTSYGQPSSPTSLTNIMAVAAGDFHVLALRTDGTVIAWHNGSDYEFNLNNYGQANVPLGLSNVVAIAAFGLHNVALRADGTVAAWGFGDFGAYGLSAPPASLTNAVAIAAGFIHNVALKADGTVVAWGDNSVGQTSVPPDLTNAVAIAAGHYHSLALKADGTVAAWGATGFIGGYGQNVVPSGLTNIVAIAAGNYHSLALRSDDAVVGWGYNSHGQANMQVGLTNVVAIAAGYSHNLALRSNGTVVAWGSNIGGESSVPVGLKNVAAISGGGGHSEALIGNGPPVLHAFLMNPSWNTSDFSVSVPTQSGRVYRLEYLSSLADRNWTSLPLVAGNGGVQVLTDSTATNSQRFYRVRQW